MSIAYQRATPTAEQFVDLYRACSLGARRPLDHAAELIASAPLIVSAWDSTQLVGLARGWSDHVHTTYLADLAVRDSHQRHGIGRQLINELRTIAPQAMIVLIAAPQAHEYYGRLGFAQHRSCWVLKPGMELA